MPTPPSPSQDHPLPALPWHLLLGAILLLCVPVLLVDYLPQTDLPQHLSVVSILQHLDDPAFDFARYYTVDLGRTLYLLPYGLALLLGTVLPLPLALHCIVFLSTLSYPLAMLRLLRALRKPRVLVLLALPLTFNSAFYWGFINFQLAIGLSFWAIALFIEEKQTLKNQLLLALLSGLLVFTHLYGLALLLGQGLLSLLLGPRRETARRLLPMAPAVAGVLVWPWPEAPEGLGYSWPGLYGRIGGFAEAVFGNYRENGEWLLLIVLIGSLVLLTGGRRGFRLSMHELRTRPWPEQALVGLVAANLVLYLVLPRHTPTAMWIHFRHALLALALLPALAPSRTRLPGPVVQGVLLAVAAAAMLVVWATLWRFDREAADFEHVRRRVPPRSRLLSLILSPHGDVMATHAYLHFGAYIQAQKGGYISTSFARFWNIPIKTRQGLLAPETPNAFEWNPLELYDYSKFGYYYRFVLVRRATHDTLPRSRAFPYALILHRGPWQLYRKVEDPRAIPLGRTIPQPNLRGRPPLGHPKAPRP